jgi:hypothetical protein
MAGLYHRCANVLSIVLGLALVVVQFVAPTATADVLKGPPVTLDSSPENRRQEEFNNRDA